MFPSELLTANKKIMHVYESFCTPLCKKYQLNQSDLDLILFIANNPMYNTAKDVCEIRGIKKGIVSVTTERLVQSGYLIRKNDIHDRRIQRLCLTEKCQPIIADGREMQTHFFTEICFSQTLLQPFLLNLCQRLQLSYTSCRNLISDCLCNPVHSYQICHPLIPCYDSIRIRLIKSGAERLVGSCSP